MDYLISICKENEASFLNQEGDLFSYDYKFTDASIRHPFIVVPSSYPELVGVSTQLQTFGIDDFEVTQAVLTIPTIKRNLSFNIYIYKQGLVTLNQQLVFKFK